MSPEKQSLDFCKVMVYKSFSPVIRSDFCLLKDRVPLPIEVKSMIAEPGVPSGIKSIRREGNQPALE